MIFSVGLYVFAESLLNPVTLLPFGTSSDTARAPPAFFRVTKRIHSVTFLNGAV